MRAYFRHQRIEGMGIYLRPGRQDLTADVNFVDLQEWGEQLGLKTIQIVTQADFIRKWDREPITRSQETGRSIYDRTNPGWAKHSRFCTSESASLHRPQILSEFVIDAGS